MAKTEIEENPPTHDCPIMGPDTKLVRALNIKTGETRWICAWCSLKDYMLGKKGGL